MSTETHRGYGEDGYGEGGYGEAIANEPDPEPDPDPEPEPDPGDGDSDDETDPSMPDHTYQETGEQLDNALATLRERMAALEAAIPDEGDALTDEQLEHAIDEALADAIDYEALAEKVAPLIDTGGSGGAVGGDGSAGFPQDLRDEFESRATEFRFPARLLNDVDPQADPGRYHDVNHWGLDFSVTRPCHLRTAVVDAEETGTFTAVLNRYLNDAEEFEVVERTEITIETAGEPVQIDLGFDVPEAGRYHLTRDGNFGLWRGEYSNWDDHFVDGMRINTGAKPDSLRDGGYNDEDYWYYYYSLEAVASENHEFER